MKRTIQSILITACLLISVSALQAQEKEIKVASFNKVVISPHIEVTFVKGAQEKVTIEDSDVPLEKINIDVDGRTLRIYLDGAKTYTKSKKVKYDGMKGRVDMYYDTQVTITVTYKQMDKLEVRGEETVLLKSPLDQEEFELVIYGESEVMINEADLGYLTVAIYGESTLKIAQGEVGFQKYRAYGESEVDVLGLNNNSAKITAFGESEFRINVSDRLKVTSYGESEVRYRGNPTIDKGIVIGENSIIKI